MNINFQLLPQILVEWKVRTLWMLSSELFHWSFGCMFKVTDMQESAALSQYQFFSSLEQVFFQNCSIFSCIHLPINSNQLLTKKFKNKMIPEFCYCHSCCFIGKKLVCSGWFAEGLSCHTQYLMRRKKCKCISKSFLLTMHFCLLIGHIVECL